MKKVYTDKLYDKLDTVEYARNDYLRDSVEDYEVWLLNKDWLPLPTIRLSKENGPLILTCRFHNKGSNKMMIHAPRLPKHILPSTYSDQLCHAVINCRTIKPMRRTKYSTQFELYEQKGTFNGIDTFGLTDFQNMSISSELLAHYESLSIVHRKDINSLLTQLVKEKKIGKVVANDRRIEANYRVDKLEMDFDSLVSGCTYVPINATMCFVKDQTTHTLERSFNRPGDEGSRVMFNTFRPIWPRFLYPCQKMDMYGCYFPCIPTLLPREISDQRHMDNRTTISLWTTIALMTRLQLVWDAVSSVNLCMTKWEGWILNFLSKSSYSSQSTRYQSKCDPFKPSQCHTALQVYQKFDNSNSFMTDPKVVFERTNDKIFIVDCPLGEDIDTLAGLINSSHDVIIFHEFEYSGDQVLDDKKIYHNVEYELLFASTAYEFEVRRGRQISTKWNSISYSRHGGKRHNKWWYFSRFDKMSIQHTGDPEFDANAKLTLAYGKSETQKVDKYKKDFMTYIGGKKNLYCDVHKCPLIASTQRESLCVKCKQKKEYFTCCSLSCRTCLCKTCADSFDPSIPNFVQEEAANELDAGSERDVDVSNDRDTNANMDIDTDTNVNMDMFQDIEDLSDDELIEPYRTDSVEDEELLEPYQVGTVQDILNNEDDFNDNFEDFVVTADEPDSYHEENHEFFPTDTIPTTDTGEKAQTIIEANALNQNRVSGHVILNQCGSLLSRCNHDIKGSSKHKFFLQKIHATSDGESIPLLYPESMLFPSIFPFCDPDGIPSLGCIPAPLLSSTIQKYGFESIPQHTRTRLTVPFCK